MAKKISTPAPPVPDEFRRQYQSKFAPIPCEPNFKRGIDRLPDEVAGRLLKAVLQHTVSGSTEPPQGMDAFAFDMLLSKVDEFLEYGLENSWKRQYRARSGSESRWRKEGAGEPEEPRENALAYQSIQKHANNNINNNANNNDNENENTKAKPYAQARGTVGEGREIDLSEYLTGEEEERLFEGVGNFTTGLLERFVLSDYFRKSDALTEKEKKLAQFVEDENRRAEAEAEEAERKRKEAERVARLAAYSPCQKPRDFAELRQFCQDTGHEDFDAAGFWDEMEYYGWKIKDKKTGNYRPLVDWRKFVQYRISHAQEEGPREEPETKTGGGQDWR